MIKIKRYCNADQIDAWTLYLTMHIDSDKNEHSIYSSL